MPAYKPSRRRAVWFSRSNLLRTVSTALACASITPRAAADVLTYHNDLSRTGLNQYETLLTPSNVNVTHFGKLFSHAVDGLVYAQLLYVSGLVIGGQTHNVLFVATEHNSVYAFDADSNFGANASPLWQASLGRSVPNQYTGAGEIGITGTPVIDPSSQTLYVVAKSFNTALGRTYFMQHLHALDITTGREKVGSPVLINAVVPGTGDGSAGGTLPFLPLRQHNRCGLLLLNGVVYIAFASHGDATPYHGWILGYNATSLKQIALFNTTPNGKTDPSGYPIGGGGVWQAGAAPASDGSAIYFEVGNGTFDADPSLGGGIDYGDSVLKLSAGAGLSVADFFTPYNQQALNDTDADLGSGGAMLLPDGVGSATHPHLMVACGKQGSIYLIDREAMGHFNPANDNNVVQHLDNAIGGTWSMPAYFNNTIYYCGVGDTLKAYSIANATMSTTPIAHSPNWFGYPGATPAISANGVTNGIVWLLDTGGISNNSPAVLYAYSAANVGQMLYSSAQLASRDAAGPAVRFCVPTVANGKVYVGAAYEIDVYGLH